MKTSIFIFMAGDNNLDVSGTQDIQEMIDASISDDINVIVQFDRRKAMPWENPSERSTKRFMVKNHELHFLMDIGETNTGDPAVLHDFLSWGMKNYPAGRNIVVIWNHGGGIKDTDIYKSIAPKVRSSLFVPEPERENTYFDNFMNIKTNPRDLKTIDDILNVSQRMVCTDDTSRDFLDNIELKSALSLPRKKFDIIAFDACLMSMFEIMYQSKDQADFIIGSQEIEPPEGWPYKSVLDYLSSDPSVSTQKLSAQIVELFKKSYIGKGKSITQSAISSKKINETAHCLDIFAENILSSFGIIQKDLYDILSATQRFRENDYIDLYDFVMLCKNNIKIDAVNDTANKLLQSLNEIIIANRTHGDSVKNAHGISIYFPLKRPDSEMLDIYNKLDFNIKYKNWLKLVELFHEPKALKRD